MINHLVEAAICHQTVITRCGVVNHGYVVLFHAILHANVCIVPRFEYPVYAKRGERSKVLNEGPRRSAERRFVVDRGRLESYISLECRLAPSDGFERLANKTFELFRESLSLILFEV